MRIRPTWFNDVLVVVRAGTRTDRYGNETRDDWDNPTETTIEGCLVNPVAGAEDFGRLDERSALTRRWVVNAPVDADIQHDDRIRWNSDDYGIEGEVLRWESPTGNLDHLYFQLERVEG
jgi:hypothetical protein